MVWSLVGLVVWLALSGGSALGMELRVEPALLTVSVAQGDSATGWLLVSAAGDSLAVSASATVPWLDVYPDWFIAPEGMQGAALSVYVSPAHLPPGVYQGQIVLTADGATNSPVFVLCEMTVTQVEWAMNVFPTSISVTQIIGEPDPEPISLLVKNDGFGVLGFDLDPDVGWMDVEPYSGVSTGDWAQVTVTFTNIPFGVNTGAITVYAHNEMAAHSPWTVPVMASLLAPPPTMSVSVDELSAEGYQEGSTVEVLFYLGPEDPNLGGYSFTATTYDSWITVSPTSGVFYGTEQAIVLTLDPAGLEPGDHFGAVTVEQEGTDNREVVSVEFQVGEVPRVVRVSGDWEVATPIGTVAVREVRVWNAGNGELNYHFNGLPEWLSIVPASGSVVAGSTNVHEALFDAAMPDSLEGGHDALLHLETPSPPAVNAPIFIPVRLDIASALEVHPARIEASLQQTGGPASLPFTVRNTGSSNPVVFTLSHESATFVISEYGGFSMGNPVALTVEVIPGGLNPGVYQDFIKVEAEDGFELEIPVVIRIEAQQDVYEEAIVFSLHDGSGWNIWRVRPDGSGAQALVRRAGSQFSPRISPDGNRLLFREARSGMDSRMVVLDLRTGVETYLDDLESPRWLFNNRQVAGVQDIGTSRQLLGGTIRVLTLEGSEVVEPLYHATVPIRLFGVDRLRNLLFVERPQGGPTRVMLHNRRTSRTRALLEGARRSDSSGSITPNAERVVFESGSGTHPKVLLLNVPRQATLQPISNEDAVIQRWPALSPDARRIAIVRELAGTNAICAADANGANFAVIFEADAGEEIAELDWGMVAQSRNRMTVSPTRIDSQAYAGSSDPITETFTVRGEPGMSLTYGITDGNAWMRHDKRDGGTSTGETHTVTLIAAPRYMPAGNHRARYQVIGNAGNAPVRVEWNLHLLPHPPGLRPVFTDFFELHRSPAPIRKPIEVVMAGAGEATFQIVSHAPWLTFDVTSATFEESSHFMMSYLTGGLPIGTHTGRFDFVQIKPLGNVTQHCETVIYLYDEANTAPAELSISTTSITATTPRLRNAASQSFQVWNAGGNGADGNQPLGYTVTIRNHMGDSDWLHVHPGPGLYTSRGERDVFEVRFNTDKLNQQPPARLIEVSPSHDPATKQTILVSLTLEPAQRFTLTLQNPPHLTLHADPPPGADGKYEDGTSVRLWATPASGYELNAWTGDETDSIEEVELLMDRDKSVSAIAAKLTMLSGIISDSMSSTPIAGATVTMKLAGETRSVTTDANGRYELAPVWPGVVLTTEANGYHQRVTGPTIVPGQWNTLNIPLDPILFGNFEVELLDPRAHILGFRYRLLGTRPQYVRFEASFSTDPLTGERFWHEIRGSSLHSDGDINKFVEPGQRFFLWHVAAYRPNAVVTNAIFAIRVGSDSAYSRPFDIDTQTVYDPVIYTYNDYKISADPALPGAEVYISGRTSDHLQGVTDQNGFFRWTGGTLRAGDVIFARKKFATRSAVKGNHGNVGGLMWTLWLDSDIGGNTDRDYNRWDGVWRSYRVTSYDMALLQRGEPLRLRLNHTLYEWNLMIDFNAKSEARWEAIRRAIPYASQYLYKVTDGQMKLGDVYISKNKLCDEDVRVRTSVERASANCRGIYSSGCVFYTHNIMMPMIGTAPDSHLDWARILIHEFGHYVFNFKDEYEGSSSDQKTFTRYKNRYPFKYPENYGLMDSQGEDSALSSPNDYLDAMSKYRPNKDSNIKRYVTEQFYERKQQSTWEQLRREYNRSSVRSNVEPTCGDRWPRILAQFSGVFMANPDDPTGRGVSSVADRKSTTNIPAPYYACRTREVGGQWVERGEGDASSNRRKTTSLHVRKSEPAEHINIRLTGSGDRPVAGARVGIQAAGHGAPFELAGYTGRDGRLMLDGVRVGDHVLAYAAGQYIRHIVTIGDIGQDLDMRLGATTVRRDAPAPLAMLIRGDFDGSDYLLTLTPSHELAGPPVVLLTLDESEATAITMLSVGGSPTRYQGRIPLESDSAWAVEISASAGGGRTFHTVDGAELVPISTNASAAGAILKPSAELLERDTFALVYRAYGPVPALAPGEVHVPPAVHVALMDGSVMTPLESAQLTLDYSRSLPTGLDESQLVLRKWNDVTAAWDVTEAEYSVSDRRAYTQLEEDAVFALFAPVSNDTIPPAAITDLVARQDEHYHPRIHLSWTATGDDGSIGTASAYELIMSREPLTEERLTTLKPRPLGIEPAPSGASETYDLDPPPEENWYFALRARDKAGNVSPFSNVASARPSRPIEEGKVFPAQYLATMAMLGYPDLDPDGDEDGDGLTNYEEFLLRTDPLNADTDGDGMPDGYEVRHGLNPLNAADAWGDLDGDGIPNIIEMQLGTDPSRYSTLGDGISDGWKLRHGLPLLSSIDTAYDADGDGFSLLEEFIADTDPFDAASYLHIKEFVLAPGTIDILLDASVQRLFSIDAATDLTGGPWQPVAGPHLGLGSNTAFRMPLNRTAEVFRVRAKVP